MLITLSIIAIISALVCNAKSEILENEIEQASVEPDKMHTEKIENVTMSQYTREELKISPDVGLTTPELIKKYGFPVETHIVITEDDYVLTMFRIPHGRFNKNSTAIRPAVFLQHGLISCSTDWLMNTADKALPYKLADAGYDVWLGNARGTAESNRHITLTPKNPKYWDFSWHEMGKYDIPAVIDHILNTTEQSGIYYIGHSMGTTMFFVTMSVRPEYNEKIKLMVGFGPAVYMNHMSSPVKYLARWSSAEKTLLDILGDGELVPKTLLKYLHKYMPTVCNPDYKILEPCTNLVFILGGFDPDQTNPSQIPVILSHDPATTSSRAGIHYLQSISSKSFQQYDYGYLKNLQIYHQRNPPKYKLSKVTAPVQLVYAEKDVLCDPTDVLRLASILPNLVGSTRVNYDEFTHIDFVFAKDADTLVYNQVMDLMKKY